MAGGRKPTVEIGDRYVAALSLWTLLASLPLLGHQHIGVNGYLSSLLLLRLASLRFPALLPGRLALTAITLGGLTVVLGEHQTLFGPTAGVALLSLMLALKLLELRSPRDLQVTFVLGCFFVVTLFVFDQSLALAVYQLALSIVLVSLVIAFHGRTGHVSWIRPTRKALLIAIQALPLALIMFFLFPRLSAPLWDLDLGQHAGTTGLGDSLAPGSISHLIRSGEVAFRVRFDGDPPPPSQRYWRGPVLWRTNGQRWVAEDWGRVGLPAATLVRAAHPIEYEVMLEPSRQRWLLGLDVPGRVPQGARLTGDFQVISEHPISDPKRYRMLSFTDYRTGAPNARERLAALQLPGNISGRMRRLATQWKYQSARPQGIVRHALEYFNAENFVYTLSPPLLGANPADEFLFDTRRGFCEHYATSFVLLMRLAGIPSRVVTGYLGGELNPLSHYLVVRQYDAHAWAEVWVEDSGWIRVDPTAAVAPERIERPIQVLELPAGSPIRFRLADPGLLRGLSRRLGQVLDAVNTGWRDWVLGYSSQKQNYLLGLLGLELLRHYGLGIAMVTLCAMLLGLLAMAIGHRRKQQLAPAQQAYRIFCKRLARTGIPRREWEGPRDFSGRAANARPDLRPQIEGIVALYVSIHYAGNSHPKSLEALKRKVAAFRPGVRGRLPKELASGAQDAQERPPLAVP